MLLGYTPIKFDKKRLKELFRNRNKNKEEIIRMNLGLINKAAWSLSDRGVSYEDLASECLFGLLHAIDKYNPDMKNSFSSYAYLCILGYAKKAICKRWQQVRMPDYKYFKKGAISPAVISLDKKVKDKDTTIGDLIPDRKENCMTIETLIHGWILHGIDKKILKNSVAGMSLRENGKTVGISGERVRQRLKEIGERNSDYIK